MTPLSERSDETEPCKRTSGSEPFGSPILIPDSKLVPVISELMLLTDGRILAHNLTPELAFFLQTALDSGDASPSTESTSP